MVLWGELFLNLRVAHSSGRIGGLADSSLTVARSKVKRNREKNPEDRTAAICRLIHAGRRGPAQFRLVSFHFDTRIVFTFLNQFVISARTFEYRTLRRRSFRCRHRHSRQPPRNPATKRRFSAIRASHRYLERSAHDPMFRRFVAIVAVHRRPPPTFRQRIACGPKKRRGRESPFGFSRPPRFVSRDAVTG